MSPADPSDRPSEAAEASAPRGRGERPARDRLGLALTMLLSLALVLGLRLLVVRHPAPAARPAAAPARPAGDRPAATPSPRPAVPAARGTPVAPAEEASPKELRGWLERWREAWAARDLERYGGFYSDTFGAQGLGLTGWLAAKRRIFNDPEPIHLELDDVTVRPLESIVVVDFRQLYRRGDYRDVGRKTLYLRREGSGWRIFNEEWTPLE